MKHFSRGFGLIELVVGGAILSLVLLGLTTVTIASLQLAEDNESRARAALLLEEGMEATRSIRDRGWNIIGSAATSTALGLSWTGGQWTLVSGSTTVSSIDRSITFSDVYRDGNQDIAPTGGLDSNIKKVTVRVSYTARAGLITQTLEGYLTNLFE